jgi:hypothetical protein
MCRAAICRLVPVVIAAGACPEGVADNPPVSSPEAQRGEPASIDYRDINLGHPDADERVVHVLIEQLGYSAFAVRQEAAEGLSRLGPSAFRLLSRTYRQREDYEIRLRIEEIVQQQFLWHCMLKHRGFLGIAYRSGVFGSSSDGGGGPFAAVEVQDVQPGTPAAEAGLRRDDLIVTVDGRPLDPDISTLEFNQSIQARGPGGELSLGLLRDGQRVEVEVILTARPLKHYLTDPVLLDELVIQLERFAIWWNTFFALPTEHSERSPSTAVFRIPE